MEVTNTPDGKLPTETAANAGSTEVARSADSAKRHDLNFITSNNKIDAEYQLPVTADAKGTWVCQLLDVQLRTSRGRPCDVFVSWKLSSQLFKLNIVLEDALLSL